MTDGCPACGYTHGRPLELGCGKKDCPMRPVDAEVVEEEPTCPDCGHTVPIVTSRHHTERHWARHTESGSLTSSDGPECTNSNQTWHTPCRCCGADVLPFVAGSYPEHGLCDVCGRGKCDTCITEVRKLWGTDPLLAESGVTTTEHAWMPEVYTGPMDDVTQGVYTFNTDAAQLAITAEVIDAEVVEDPTPVPLQPVPREATVRMIPSGRECWWRLYSTPTSPLRSHQDHGVRAVHVYTDNPHRLTLELDDGTTDDWSVLAYEISGYAVTEKGESGQVQLDHAAAKAIAGKRTNDNIALRGPDSIDILAEHCPIVPGRPRFWQQMTRHGQLEHPGDDRANWSFDDGFCTQPSEPGRTSDDLLEMFGENGFKPLGHTDEGGLTW